MIRKFETKPFKSIKEAEEAWEKMSLKHRGEFGRRPAVSPFYSFHYKNNEKPIFRLSLTPRSKKEMKEIQWIKWEIQLTEALVAHEQAKH